MPKLCSFVNIWFIDWIVFYAVSAIFQPYQNSLKRKIYYFCPWFIFIYTYLSLYPFDVTCFPGEGTSQISNDQSIYSQRILIPWFWPQCYSFKVSFFIICVTWLCLNCFPLKHYIFFVCISYEALPRFRIVQCFDSKNNKKKRSK